MLDFSQISFKGLAIHGIGNKMRHEDLILSGELYPLQDELLRQLLFDYFLIPFKREEYHQFAHSTGQIENNVVFQNCRQIFNDRNYLLEASQNIARHLFNQSTHPNIKSGELYITYFSDCVRDDELVDAIGIFKSENRDTFLIPESQTQKVNIRYEQGINIKKLDKGCLVFNTFDEDGYRILIVDKLSKNKTEAEYWKNDFLGLNRVHDHSFNTENYLLMCKSYCEDVYAEEANKKDQVLFLNKSLGYFTDHESFDFDEFTEEVLVEPEKVNTFSSFKNEYMEQNGVAPVSDFMIAQPVVKGMKRKFKSLIQLDTNIEIKLKTEFTEQYIERGYDEKRNMYFYKVYFLEEN